MSRELRFMAKGARLPGDATVADLARAQQLRRDAPRIKNLRPEELQARVRQSVNMPVPMDNSDRLSIDLEGQIQLKITDIDPYDKNPRQAANNQYEAIKESIRSSRMLAPLVVTKRPGATRFMVGAGGNSRLKAQKELWLETQDPRYEYLLVTYRPWESEVKTLAAHVAENELRGEMIFWDKARGIWAMKEELEAERESSFSLRQLHDALRGHGLSVSITLLSFYSFALDNLVELGEATRYLSGAAVTALQPAFKHLSTYFISAHGRSTEEWNSLRVNVLQSEAQSLIQESQKSDESGEEQGSGKRRLLDAEQLIAALEHAIALALNQTVAQVRDVRQLARTLPKASMSELLQHHQDMCARKPNRPTLPSSEQAPTPGNATSTMRTGSAASSDETSGAAAASKDRSGGHQEPASSAPPFPLPSSFDPLKTTQECVTAFSRLCEFADCLRLTDAMPSGYFVEVPADDTPIDLDPEQSDRNRYTGWWLAAMHSGQIDGAFSHRLPESSKWRQAQLMEHGENETALQWLIETVLGNPIGLIEMADWLTQPQNRAIADYLQLLKAIQHLRTENPERFSVEAAQ